jgi:hypothetical protein
MDGEHGRDIDGNDGSEAEKQAGLFTGKGNKRREVMEMIFMITVSGRLSHEGVERLGLP